MLVATIMTYGCTTLFGQAENESCPDLVDDIVELSQDAEVPLTGIVDISELSIPSKRLSCKGLARPEQGPSLPIEFYEWENGGGDTWIEYKDLRITEWECDYLLDAVIDLSQKQWARSPFENRILKMYDPEKVAYANERLTCKGVALLDSLNEQDIEFYTWVDKDGDRFYGYEAQ